MSEPEGRERGGGGGLLVVVLAVLDVVAAHDLDLAQVRVLLPLPVAVRVSAAKRTLERRAARTLRKSTFLRSFCS